MLKVGIEPILVLRLRASGSTEDAFLSTEEILAAETNTITNPTADSSVELLKGKSVTALVQSFGSISQSAEFRGFGSIGQISVKLNDFSGLMKQATEQVNLYDYECDLLLFVRQPRKSPECHRLLSGAIGGPFLWNEGERTFEFTLISGVQYKEFGFVPEFEDISFICENLEGSNWPHLFGVTTGSILKPVCNVPTATVAFDLYVFRDMPERQFVNESGVVVTVPAITTYVNPYSGAILTGGDVIKTVPVHLQLENYSNMPRHISGLEEAKDYIVSMKFEGGEILCLASFENYDFWIKEFNRVWFSDIVCWSPPQHSSGFAVSQDSPAYLPNVVQMLGYGSFNEPDPDQEWTFNVYDELVDVTTIPPGYTFPIEDPDIGWTEGKQDPRIEGMFVRIKAVRVYRNFETGQADAVVADLWATVLRQEGFTLFLTDIRDLNDQPFSLDGFRVYFIEYAIGNKVFQPNSIAPQPLPAIIENNSKSDILIDRGLTDDDYSGVYDLAVKIPAGAQIQVLDWWGPSMFPLTLDVETNVSTIYLKTGNSYIDLYQGSQVAWMRYIKGVPGDSPWWLRVDYESIHGWRQVVWPPVADNACPIPQQLFLLGKDQPDLWPDEFSFLYVAPGAVRDLGKDSSSGAISICVMADNTICTDERIFKYLLEKYTTYTGIENPDATKQQPISTIIHEYDEGGVTGFLGNLAFEHAKSIRIDRNTVNMVDLIDTAAAPIAVFDETNVDAKSVSLTFTEEQSIKNIFKVTGTWATGKWSLKNLVSVRRHTELREDISLSLNRLATIYDSAGDPHTYQPGDPRNTHWSNPVSFYIWFPPSTDPITGAPYDLTYYYPRGFTRAMAYWLWRDSNVFTIISFTTYIEHCNLKPGDLVSVNFTDPLEHMEASKTGVLQNPPDIVTSISLPVSLGYIQEIVINPDTWVVSMSIWLPIRLGGEIA